MDGVQFKYVAELIVKPLDTFEELKKTVARFENLCFLYEEICDSTEEQRTFKLQLFEATELKDAAEKLLEGRELKENLEKDSAKDSMSGYCFANPSMKTDNALKFNSWNEKAEQTIIQLKESIAFLDHYTRDTDMVESKLLARRMKDKCSFVETSNTKLQIYKLPACVAYEDSKSKVRLIRVGPRDIDSLFRPTKVVMMTGMTGSGKTLMMNAFVNYLYGVDFHDSFRFQLVEKSQEKRERDFGSDSEAMSMTSWVTGYELKWQTGFRFEENLLLIDTPGFSDPRGLLRDQEIIQSIKQFFEDDSACIVGDIAAVAFIMKASSNRLTKEEKYCIDQVLSLFGVDLGKNLTILFTFSDDEDPPALEVVRADKIPFIEYLCMNNCSVFGKQNPMNKLYWEQNEKALDCFFKTLSNIEVTDLNLTKEVLKERDCLKIVLEDLKRRIGESILMLKDMEACIDAVLAIVSNIGGHEQDLRKVNFSYRTHRKVLETVSKYCMNCKTCKHSCHVGCRSPWNYWCSCFDSFSNCKVCDRKCGKKDHVKECRMYKIVETQVSHTVDSLLQKHQIPTEDPEAERKLLGMLLDNYNLRKECVFYKILNAISTMHKLDIIALRNTMFTEEDYLTYLIEREVSFGTSDGNDRRTQVEMLEQMREVLRIGHFMQNSIRNASESFDAPQSRTIMEIWLNMHGGYERQVDDKLTSFQQNFVKASASEKCDGAGILNRTKRLLNIPIGTEAVGAYQLLDRKVVGSSPPN